jgi:flagellar hook assembly protein FlgD
MAVPHQRPGPVSVRYYGYNNAGQRQPSGQYRILVVASNSGGSATTETRLVIR